MSVRTCYCFFLNKDCCWKLTCLRSESSRNSFFSFLVFNFLVTRNWQILFERRMKVFFGEKVALNINVSFKKDFRSIESSHQNAQTFERTLLIVNSCQFATEFGQSFYVFRCFWNELFLQVNRNDRKSEHQIRFTTSPCSNFSKSTPSHLAPFFLLIKTLYLSRPKHFSTDNLC